MPIKGIEQPEMLEISQHLRLRKFDGTFDFALPWYQDPETVRLMDGEPCPYDPDRLARMYHYLNDRGELYFIEIKEGTDFIPIGDVTFWQDDMPIVIGPPEYRGQGIGRQAIARLIQRGKELGYACLFVHEIYAFNAGSRRLFEGLGFRAYEETAQGNRYRLSLAD